MTLSRYQQIESRDVATVPPARHSRGGQNAAYTPMRQLTLTLPPPIRGIWRANIASTDGTPWNMPGSRKGGSVKQPQTPRYPSPTVLPIMSIIDSEQTRSGPRPSNAATIRLGFST
jgi:hypothetical protein